MAAKEQRVEDVAMDQGPQDASLTKMRMDAMLMEQVKAGSCGTSRICGNEEKYVPATIRGLPADLVKKGQAREMKDLDDLSVLEWVKGSTEPRDAKILDCGWAMKNDISIRSASSRRLERLRSRTDTHEQDCEMVVVLRSLVWAGSQHF